MQQVDSSGNNFSFSTHPRVGGKEADYAKGYWIRHAETISSISHVITTNCWVPSVFKNGVKKNSEFLFSDMLGFDFDNGKFTLEEACQYFKRYVHIIGTTKSHQKEKDGNPPCDRFRVAVLWQARISDVVTYHWNAKRLGVPLSADPAGFRPSQYLKPCKEIVSLSDTGDKFAVHPAPPKRVFKPSVYEGARTVPPDICAALTFGVADSCRHDVIIKTSIKLAFCGFTEDETVGYIMNSSLKGSRDAERTARDGWQYGAAKDTANRANEIDGVRDDGDGYRDWMDAIPIPNSH